MASTPKIGYTQDLPPKGGYAAYQIERIPLRKILGGRFAITVFYGVTTLGMYLYYNAYKTMKRNEIEMRSSRLAILPLLLAEKDRALMKYMKLLRDAEIDLMKDIPGWEVGTFFGEPIYHTLPEDSFVEPTTGDLLIHSDPAKYDHFSIPLVS